MGTIIQADFRGRNAAGLEASISPAALLPILRKVKKLSPENYAFIVKTLCIYGYESPDNLLRLRQKAGEV